MRNNNAIWLITRRKGKARFHRRCCKSEAPLPSPLRCEAQLHGEGGTAREARGGRGHEASNLQIFCRKTSRPLPSRAFDRTAIPRIVLARATFPMPRACGALGKARRTLVTGRDVGLLSRRVAGRRWRPLRQRRKSNDRGCGSPVATFAEGKSNDRADRRDPAAENRPVGSPVVRLHNEPVK